MPEKSLESALHEEYARLEQGSYTSGVIAGLASEQVRKLIFAIDDNGLDKPLLTGTTLSYRPHNGLNESRKPLKGISILQVGAGAIGNFAALNLALVGIGIIHIVDYDTIESTNLNRSPFLHGKIGKSKARVLSERLREINPSINVIYSRQKFGKRTFKSSKYLNTYDAILGCVDNNRGRYHINKFAIERNMPYIDGGTGHASGRFGLYVPKVNACMDCRYNLMESLSHPEKRGNCPGNLEPAIVIPNIIIGSAMVAELMNLLSGNPTFTKNTFKYDTLVDSRIYEEPVRVIGNCGMNC